MDFASAGPSGNPSGSASPTARRKRNHRAGKKKKKARRKSFATPSDDMGADEELTQPDNEFYLQRGRTNSNTSLDSEALLDHREQQSVRPRRPSIAGSTLLGSQQYNPGSSRLRTVHGGDSGEDDDEASAGEGAPLLSQSVRMGLAGSEPALRARPGYGSQDTGTTSLKSAPRSRNGSNLSTDRRKFTNPFASTSDSYNVNFPPSVPGSPLIQPSDRIGINLGDDLLRDEIRNDGLLGRAATMADLGDRDRDRESPGVPSPLERRHTVCLPAEEDVCFPQEGLSEMADDDLHPENGSSGNRVRARRRRGKWPDLAVLEEWSHLEKEGRSDERRVKKITEPQLINGRLRPVGKTWFRAEDDAPYRFTYFNEDFQSTIHSQTISELAQPGAGFRELFIPEPTVLEDSSDEEEDEDYLIGTMSTAVTPAMRQAVTPGLSNIGPDSRLPSRSHSLTTGPAEYRPTRTVSPTTGRDGTASVASAERLVSGQATPVPLKSPVAVGGGPATLIDDQKTPTPPEGKPVKFGERPVWWLDILSPTEAEMRVLSKAFGIHPLTAEDIIMQEAREKVELFRHYYFVNYRTFDQDQGSENFLEPVNMYVVVFREGVLSFHFSITPHPANVRRRVRQLRDYMMLSADWISYAIIDDITDVFVPLIQRIEEEVDEIDDAVLALHSATSGDMKKRDSASATDSAMLRRVGDCRKKVMGLYRLLGNKADVIKGFAKRCNEHWEVAPRSDIGLYLGDIQDHIVTMTSNLGHYEKILARSHANYLAQINLRMNERQEETADILGKLTILGTIVLPMNLVTGLWGMNVWVPGQEMEGDLRWFYCITTMLVTCGLLCFWIVKRLYGL